MKTKYKVHFFFITALTLLCGCSNQPSLDDMDGILDSNYTQVTVDKSTKPYYLTIKFKPALPVPAGAVASSYVMSFVIDTSNTLGSDVEYFDHETSFVSFNIIDTKTSEMVVNGTSFSYCTAPCSYFINSITDENNNSIITNDAIQVFSNKINLRKLVTHKTKLSAINSTVMPDTNGFITIKVGIDPLHLGENWSIRHGFPGQEKNKYVIEYPFYRAKFTI